MTAVLSVRSLTVALCFASILVTAAVSLGITFKFSLGAAQDIAKQHAAALASTARGNVEEFLNKPIGALSGVQYVLRQNEHPLPNVTEPTDPTWYLWWWEQAVAVMRAAEFKYQYAVVGFNDGNYAGCKLIPVGFQCRVFSTKTRAATGRSWVHQRDYNISNYAQLGNATSSIVYDPRTRAWYRMVEHAPWAMRWSSVYLSVSPTLPIVDINGALFNATGHMIGVLSITFELAALSDFVRRLQTTPNTKGVLIDNDGLLLASSYPSPFLTEETIPFNYSVPLEPGCLKSDTANDATSSILVCRKSITNYPWGELNELNARHPDLVARGQSNAVQRIVLGGVAYYVVVAPITTAVSAGMSWRYVLLMPELDITAPIIRGRDVAIGIVAAFLVVASVLSFTAIRALLHPLDRISERMYRTAHLQDDGDADPPSSLYELAVIQMAYEAMKSELDKVKSYLPQSVMAALYGDAADSSEQPGSDDEGDINDVVSESISTIASSRHSSRQVSRHASFSPGPANQQHRNSNGKKLSTPGDVSADVPHINSSSKNAIGAKKGSNVSDRSSVVGAAPTVALKTALKLVTRKVTVLAVNACGFHAMARNCPPDAIIRQHGEMLQAINTAIHNHKGVVDSFHGDHVIASFNAVTSVGSHAPAAARAALAIRAELLKRRVEHKILGVNCGIATGQAQVGNMGSGNLRRFCIVGQPYGHALVLERLCKRYGQPQDGVVLLSGVAIADCEQFFEIQYLDVISVADSKRVRLAALKSEHAEATDEWMYSLGSATAYSLHNESFCLFCEGDVTGARAAMKKHREFVLSREPRPLEPHEWAASQHLETLLARDVDPRSYSNPQVDYFMRCLANVTDAPISMPPPPG